MRGGWDDPMTHAHFGMFVSGLLIGALLVAIVWVALAA